MPEQPKILTRKAVCHGKLFHVESAHLRFSNGEEREYEYLTGGNGAVLVVPMVSDTEVLMVQEYGIGVDAYEWGFPKGKVDPGESFLEAANRELKEEAGMGARKLTVIKVTSQSPNYMQHKTHIVLAQDLYPERLEGDEPEELDVCTFSMDDVDAILARDDISEARTIAALFIAKQWLAARNEKE